MCADSFKIFGKQHQIGTNVNSSSSSNWRPTHLPSHPTPDVFEVIADAQGSYATLTTFNTCPLGIVFASAVSQCRDLLGRMLAQSTKDRSGYSEAWRAAVYEMAKEAKPREGKESKEKRAMGVKRKKEQR
jgi:hypothetical protein